ncbi:uncharacterized protein LOC131944049 [Physella acuta]|uniref:uncharacterized protein LOC131944049 n=1 Tax=Physella acuta TaxID=109671 RepID=UPI0027DC419E|nr:uncharacterized protein LOC131944049 [Physella acuta]
METAGIWLSIALVICWSPPVCSHGRLWEPPGRSTMWRRGYGTPINYQDNQLFCGGFGHQQSLGYRCGVCGDPYDGMRENEEGGKYATGTVTNTYTQGQRATFQVDLTANHRGYFEFRICPKNSAEEKTTQECLDLHLVKLADGSGSRFQLTSGEAKMYDIDVVLPSDVTCDFCVLQWHYHAGNSWGVDPDGRQCIGCGPQESFYGCSDIRILPAGGVKEVTNSRVTQALTSAVATTTTSTGSSCIGAKGQVEYNDWCQTNCPLGNCPPDTCVCGDQSKSCVAVAAFSTVDGSREWCQLNCAAGHCPASMCSCS